MKTELRLIFCGDRKWKDRGWIIQIMSALKSNLGEFTVIEGEAPGADLIARHAAEDVLDLPVDPTPADWDHRGRAAGPFRNTEMLVAKRANGVIAFHLDLSKSKGTANMIKQAREAGRPVWICTDGEETLTNFILELKKIKAQKGV